MVIDTHAHLVDEIYTDLDRIIAEMSDDNLSKIVCASADFEGCKKALKIASLNKDIYCMIGIHPDNSTQFTSKVREFISENAKQAKVVAIGEIGLDYHTDGFDKNLQKQVFIKQLEIAHEHNLPVNIHIRDAFEDALEILKDNKHLTTNGGIIHCFSGSKEIANEFIKLGFHIGLGGVLTFKNAKKCVEVASWIDVKKIVVETDCPWLAPDPFRGKRNEPKYVNFVVQKLADIKQMSKLSLEEILLQNTYEVYRKLK